MSLKRSGLVLYGTDGCHLCEEADGLLRQLLPLLPDLSWQHVDIANDDQLFERYGWIIPVLRDDAGSELRWPFDAGTLAGFLGGAEPPPEQRAG